MANGSKNGGGMSRRRFLEMVGMAGGAAAVYETMTAMGLINIPHASAGPPRIPKVEGNGKKVLILGAGVGGLTAAYELSRAGYQVEILEAQDRAGGRSLTARNGTQIHEVSKLHGATEQTCRFDEGQYLNMGPGRLPYHHRRVLRYCKELGVPLEVYVMETTANLFQGNDAFGGQSQVNRQVANDTRGYIAELLAKAVNKKKLDKELKARDLDKSELLSLLQEFGKLGQCETCDPCDPYTYFGTTRDGCKVPPQVDQPCTAPEKLPFAELLNSNFWKHRFYQPIDFEWQATLFQPVGGMDQIVQGFLHHVGGLIKYRSVVQELHLASDGVTVRYRDGFSGETCKTHADYCISNIPLEILKNRHKIQANFSPDFEWAVQQGHFAPTCKVGWQAEERFWEDDPYQIYGGISWVADTITQIWYPSNDYFTQKGTLTGAYNFTDAAIRLGNMTLADRLRTARQEAARVQPEFGDDQIVPIELGLSIAWQNIPHQEGGWAEWDGCKPDDAKAYARLLAPDGRFHIVGDQVSTLSGWQEGAIMSAEHVCEQIAGMRAMTVPEMRQAPDTRYLVDGFSG
jgi:monoamine oxidase